MLIKLNKQTPPSSYLHGTLHNMTIKELYCRVYLGQIFQLRTKLMLNIYMILTHTQKYQLSKCISLKSFKFRLKLPRAGFQDLVDSIIWKNMQTRIKERKKRSTNTIKYI